MVQRVYEQATQATLLEKVVVATDHEKIYQHVQDFGGEVYMTSPHHPSGTDRCMEALTKQDWGYDYVVNIQGDEPFIKPEQIDELARLLDRKVELATLVSKVKDPDSLFNYGIMKVVFNNRHEALYFSRECIPHVRGAQRDTWWQQHTFYKHVCLYAYRTDILREITDLPPSSLEKAESLEQLRWLEYGYTIKVGITEYESISIDTPEDLVRARKIMGIA